MNMKGRRHTEETKRRMSEAHKGKPSGMLGKYHSEESREKMRRARLGQLQTGGEKSR